MRTTIKETYLLDLLQAALTSVREHAYYIYSQTANQAVAVNRLAGEIEATLRLAGRDVAEEDNG